MTSRDNNRSKLPEHWSRAELIVRYKKLLKHAQTSGKILLKLADRVKELEERIGNIVQDKNEEQEP